MTNLSLIVGLGNPGPQYLMTRHNIGFMLVDLIRETYGFGPGSIDKKGSISEGRVGSHRVITLKPQTFMNLSGQAIQPLMQFYKLLPSQIYVVHDDIDLAPGQVRVKQGGGHGGHNGLKSIDSLIGPAYWRLRIGISRPVGHQEVSDYVLSNFTTADQEWLVDLLPRLVTHLPLLLSGNPTDYLNKIYTSEG